MSYLKSAEPHSAYDLGGWHLQCVDVQLVMNPVSGIPWLYCPQCRCTVQVDLVADRIDPISSIEVRNAG